LGKKECQRKKKWRAGVKYRGEVTNIRSRGKGKGREEKGEMGGVGRGHRGGSLHVVQILIRFLSLQDLA